MELFSDILFSFYLEEKVFPMTIGQTCLEQLKLKSSNELCPLDEKEAASIGVDDILKARQRPQRCQKQRAAEPHLPAAAT